MECNDKYRHICVEDLENYIRRDLYFSDFTEQELALVQKNLGIQLSGAQAIVGTFDNIYDIMLKSELKLGYIYIINDFRSIYTDVSGNICGLDNYIPSTTYQILLTPNSTNSFDNRVSLLDINDSSKCINWIVEYDITPTIFSDGTTSKGTITFLKDDNNNYAYYDFKNIKFKKTLEELKNGASTYTSDRHLYTFDNGGTDASETICKNNHLEIGAYRNVFLGNTQNVTLAADCHDNIFFRNCENCTFDYGTYGNYFQDSVIRCKGSVHQKTLGTITSQNCPKQFDVLDDKEVMLYLDSQTLTYQIKEL